MADFWKVSETIEQQAQDLLARYHPEVVTANFAYIFKDKPSPTELDAGIVAVAKKVSPMYKMLTEDLDFVIVICKAMWDELSPSEQTAHLDSALCSCTARLDDSGDFKVDDAGNPIFALRAYDLQGHSEALMRHGIDTFAEVGLRIKAAFDKGESATEDPVIAVSD